LKRLKKVLHSKLFLIILLSLTLIHITIHTITPRNSLYKEGDITLKGKVAAKRISNKNFIENLAREYHLDLSDKQGLKYPANFDVVHQILTVNL